MYLCNVCVNGMLCMYMMLYFYYDHDECMYMHAIPNSCWMWGGLYMHVVW